MPRSFFEFFRRAVFLLGLCLGAGLAPAAKPPALSLGELGVEIDAGAIGRITVPVPVLTLADGKDIEPACSPDGKGGLRAIYPDGFTLGVSFSGADGSIVWNPGALPPGAATLKFVTLLPIGLNQGGGFSFGDTTGEFPAARTGQFLAQGTAGRLDVIHPTGGGIRIVTPVSYQQIQDNRTWGWSVFAWVYFYDLRHRAVPGSFSFKVSSLAAAGAGPRFMVDRFGQSVRKDWPGKVRDAAELRADAAAQAAALGGYEGPALDRFGGLAGSGKKLGLKATGFFHTAVIGGGRDVLVTPEGNAFFQLGVCGIANTDDYTLVKGREESYEWLPSPADPIWRAAWLRGDPATGVFSFQIANWIRKYGKPYSYEEWTGQVADRLHAWGFNSAGAFSNYSRAMRARHLPYVEFLPSGTDGGAAFIPAGASSMLDPFAPGAEAVLDKAFAATVAARADDPLLIGYFLGNEQPFEALPELIPACKASAVAAKAKLVGILRAEYGTIDRFNAAWRPAKPFADFAELGEAPLFIRSEAAAADMRAFLRLYLESYYGMIRRVFDRHDSHHLLMGSRWTPATANNEDVVRIAGRYLDVVSVNYYTYGIERGFLSKIHDWSGGRPILLSEWYYSATDHGLGATKEVASQAARGLGYRNYVEQSAATGWVVGSEWFTYADQAATGRFFEGYNGEGNNTGLVDVTDRPYAALVNAVRATHARIYDVLLGKSVPFACDDARFSGRGGGPAKVVTVPRALPGLALTGVIAHWPGRPAEPIGADRVVIGTPNPALGGDFRLCWDEHALHFLIQVKDPTPGRNDRRPEDYWQGDGIELFIGSRHIGEGGGLRFGDRQILLGAGATPGVFVAGHPELVGQVRVVVVKNVTGEGYALQAEIPWTALDIAPKTGMELLFDVAIDNSDDGRSRSQQLVWSGTGRDSGDRGAWGRARLSSN